MKTYRRCGGQTPHITDLGTRRNGYLSSCSGLFSRSKISCRTHRIKWVGAHLTTLSVAKILQLPIRWLMGNGYKMLWKKAVVAYFKLLSQRLHGGGELRKSTKYLIKDSRPPNPGRSTFRNCFATSGLYFAVQSNIFLHLWRRLYSGITSRKLLFGYDELMGDLSRFLNDVIIFHWN